MDSLLLTAPADWFVLLLAFAALGGCSGFVAGLLGVGGGTVVVPGLFYIFKFLGFPAIDLMHVFVGTSLSVIIVNGITAARAHHKRGAVDMDLVKQMGLGAVFGVLIGLTLADILSGATLKIIFASVVLILSVVMIANPSRFGGLNQVPGRLWMGLSGGVMGCISSLAGIGSGLLCVPLLTLFKVPIHTAIGTAAALGAVIVTPAALGYIVIGWGAEGLPPYSLGYVNLPAWALIIPTSMIGARFGVKIAHLAPVSILRKAFAVFMILLSLKMWFDVLA